MNTSLKKYLGIAALVLGMGCMIGPAGCEPLTKEAAAKVAALQSAYDALLPKLKEAVERYEKLKSEWDGIQAMVKGGMPLTQAMAERLTVIGPMVAEDAKLIKELTAKAAEIKKLDEQTRADGIPWYHRVPWGAIGGILLGAAGTYFPVVRPITNAASSMVKGIEAYDKAPAEAPGEIKDFVREQAFKDGTLKTVQALVESEFPDHSL